MSSTTTIIVGPDDDDEKLDVDGMAIDDLCWRWAAWSRTRKLFGPPPIAPGILGKLTKRGTSRRGGPPDAALSPELAALNRAIAGQPEDIARRVFMLHYVHQVGHVKLAAEALGISRATWYRLLGDFRRTIHAAHQLILAENLAARDALPSEPAEQ